MLAWTKLEIKTFEFLNSGQMLKYLIGLIYSLNWKVHYYTVLEHSAPSIHTRHTPCQGLIYSLNWKVHY